MGGYRLAPLLEAVREFLCQYVVFPLGEHSIALALWVVHTHAIEAAEATPYIALTSPEKQSGKTRTQEALEHVVARPLRVSNASVAAIFRAVATSPPPTLFIDELDAVFSRHDGGEEMRGLVNAGHRRGAKVIRCIGEGPRVRVEDFEVFGPKVLAAIKGLPETVEDRSIIIRLQRKRPGERATRYRFRDAEANGRELAEAIGTWAQDNIDQLSEARPTIPDELADRAADGWEPLFALADLAGEGWPEAARAAALELSGVPRSDESAGLLLLAHLREIFGDEETDRLPTDRILRELIERDDGPWPSWWGAQVEKGETKGPASRIARLLKPYDIAPTKIRFDEDTTARGYLLADLEPVFERYLPPPPPGKTEQGHYEAQNQAPEQGCSDVPSVPSFPGGWEGNGQATTGGHPLAACIHCGASTARRDARDRPVHDPCLQQVATS